MLPNKKPTLNMTQISLKGWKKICHTNTNQKKAGMAILTSDKVNF